MIRLSAFLLLMLLLTLPASAQNTGILIGTGNTGVAFGDVPRVNGFRFNWTDDNLELVNGYNITFWIPEYEDLTGTINGISFGLVASAANRTNGFALSPVAVIAGDGMSGIHLGGLAVVSQGTISGLSIGGLAVVGQSSITGISGSFLAVVTQGDLAGLSFGGLATVAQGSVRGISFGGLAAVAQGSMSGAQIGGLAVVAQGDLAGLSLSALAVVSQGSLSGFSLGGLAVVSQSNIAGINLGGIAVVGQGDISGISLTLGKLYSDGEVFGINVGGYKIEAQVMKGVNWSLLWTESEHAVGLTVGAYNRTYTKQTGLVVGLLNHTADLAGFQVGLLNIVESGPSWARYLPFLNVRL